MDSTFKIKLKQLKSEVDMLEDDKQHLDIYLEETVTLVLFPFTKCGYFLAGKDGPFDYMSVRPPYTQVDDKILMNQISESSVIGDDSFVVVKYPFRTDMPETCGCLVKV
ncbi:hypothetical protein L6452_34413 [Arctium lappa]|uniref:Uncharacterized protein n=1 Tax=Arctium lappa TaxID=4217 RepID=A0ACB8YHH4_ARCLA|nr:hypothetical protein L6452_34413 [Arctium lappa]